MMTYNLKKLVKAASLYLIISLVTSNSAFGHIDPPRAPAHQEYIWLTAVNIKNDMDWFGSGELWISAKVQQAAPHAIDASSTRLPAGGHVDISAPPAVRFPAPYPILLYNIYNCEPLEIPIFVELLLTDDDPLFFEDQSLSNLALLGVPGYKVQGNMEFEFVLFYGINPAPPAVSKLCESSGLEEQPEPPRPPLPPDLKNPTEVNNHLKHEYSEPFYKYGINGIVIGLIIGIITGIVIFILLRTRLGRSETSK